MKLTPVRSLVSAMILGLVLASQAAPIQDNRAKLQEALNWLHKVQSGFSPTVRKDVPAIEAILQRYFTEPESLRASEEEIAVAFLSTMPSSGDVGTRGGLDKMKEFESLMGSSKPAAKTTTKPHGSTKTGHVATKPPVTTAPKVVKHKIPGVHAKPVFTASRVSAPGGKTIGSVSIAIGGHSKTVVEVLSPAPKLDVYGRAQVVASRMQRLANSNRLWWTMLKVSTVGGQYVVGTSRGSDFVITADSAFAKEWGVTPQQLAKQLVVKIRSAVDSDKSDTFGGRDTTPEEMHLAAVDLRQQGDALYKSSPGQAEDKYKQAIDNDPTYSIPYLRLADLYLAKSDKSGARAILEKGSQVDAMSADQKADIQRRLDALK